MAREKYSNIGEVSAFGFLANALDRGKGADGDTGALFPRTDAEDMSKGARFVPGEVTLARRAGEKVNFVTECGPNCWYWEMPDGSRIYHFERYIYERIALRNGRKQPGENFTGNAGPCPDCKNLYTNGGTIKP